jgi:hypothetical protein
MAFRTPFDQISSPYAAKFDQMRTAESEDDSQQFDAWTRRRFHYALLSAIWAFPSTGAVFILGKDLGGWNRTAGVADFLSSIRIEDWTAILLLIAQLVFILQAIRYRRRCQARAGRVENSAVSKHTDAG